MKIERKRDAEVKAVMTRMQHTSWMRLYYFSLSLFATISSIDAFQSSLAEPQRPSQFTLWSTPPSFDQEEGRSIGDVVQGLHGGKYQFSDAGGMSFEGQQFAEMGYSSGEPQEDNYEDEPVPNWALRLKDIVPPIDCTELKVEIDAPSAIEVQNDERSWEKYYAFVVGPNSSSFSVDPRVGILAPRGGANNFSDKAQLLIQRKNAMLGDSWLVIGTEADKWIYKLL